MLLVHLFLLISATNALKVALINGNSERNLEIEFDKRKTVNLAREKLRAQGVFGNAEESVNWRIWKGVRPVDVQSEQWIHVVDLLAADDDRLIFRNIQNHIDTLHIKIGVNQIQSITINHNEKLSKVRDYLNEKGILGSQSENCVKWKFIIRGREYVTDESQLTVAQLIESSKNNQLQMTDAYSQDNTIQLYVYAGLKSLMLPKISLSMNLFELHSTLSGAGTCNGAKYNFIDNDWLALKKTANLADLKMANPELQISPDLIFTPGEAKASTVRDAYFKSRNGRYGLEYVSKTSKKRNIIGEVVDSYSRHISPKITLRIEKNTNCFGDCNRDIVLDPVMLDNVQSTSTAIVFTSRVVVCQNGTALRFAIDTEPKTPFWIKVKHDITNDVWISTRGDYGKQSYWARGYNNIVAESHVITEQSDLLKKDYRPTFVVELYELSKSSNRRRRDVGDTITLPDGSTNDAQLRQRGSAHTGPGTDAGYGPGRFLMEVRFMLLTFKDQETAQEIMGRGVSRLQRDLP